MTTTEERNIAERWKYEGAGGRSYPVEPGQVWEVLSQGRTRSHIYACLDFMSDEGTVRVEELLRQYPPTLLYCDPPWGQGLVNGFRTKAGLDKADYRWEDLYRRVIGYVGREVPIWLESGRREREQVLEILKGYDNVTVFPATYYKRNPSLIYYAGEVPPVVDVSGMDDGDTPGVVMSRMPHGRVFDPCAGLGGTAVHAARQGWSSLSIEMSPFRQSAGLFQLSGELGTVPTLIS